MATRTTLSTALATIALVALTIATWWAFLGWDTVRNVDPATGTLGGGAIVAAVTRGVARRRKTVAP